MERTSGSSKFPIGSRLPSFKLPATNGSTVSENFLREGKMMLVAFTCNHCPYVKGSEQMLVSIVNDYAPAGLRAVAISSNDATQYPEDSLENMRVKSEQMKLPYPYLYDESQEVARQFDAACTPECYLFDAAGTLVYHGAINNSPRDPAKVRENHLAKALEQLSKGAKPEPSFVHPIGCSIKWKV